MKDIDTDSSWDASEEDDSDYSENAGIKNGRHSCHLCEKSYTRKQALNIHLLVHQNIKPWACNICGKKYTQKSHRNRHERSHEKRKLKDQNVKPVLDEEGKEVPPGVCKYCKKYFNDKSNLRRHLKGHEGVRNYTCDRCSKTFTSSQSLKTHLMRHDSVKPWICEICGARFVEKRHLVRHGKTHADMDTDSSWDASEEDDSDYSENAGIKNGRHSCHLCEKSYTRKQALNIHLLVHQNIKPWACNICGKKYTQKSHRNRHERSHEKRKLKDQKVKPVLDEQGKEVSPNVCKYCKRYFNNKSNLQRHLKRHQGLRDHTCDRCGKTFTSSQSLKIHLMRHDSVKPWICEVCGARFVESNHLARHRKKHAEQRVITCLCPICGKGFTDTDTLRCHQSVHTEERPFQCQTCGQVFKKAHTLKLHNYIHSGIKPFKCETCQRSFRTKKVFQNHLELHKRQEFTRNKSLAAPPSVFCDICGKGLANKRNLTRHYKSHKEGKLKMFNKYSNRSFTKIDDYVLKKGGSNRIEVIETEKQTEKLTPDNPAEGLAVNGGNAIGEIKDKDKDEAERNAPEIIKDATASDDVNLEIDEEEHKNEDKSDDNNPKIIKGANGSRVSFDMNLESGEKEDKNEDKSEYNVPEIIESVNITAGVEDEYDINNKETTEENVHEIIEGVNSTARMNDEYHIGDKEGKDKALSEDNLPEMSKGVNCPSTIVDINLENDEKEDSFSSFSKFTSTNLQNIENDISGDNISDLIEGVNPGTASGKDDNIDKDYSVNKENIDKNEPGPETDIINEESVFIDNELEDTIEDDSTSYSDTCEKDHGNYLETRKVQSIRRNNGIDAHVRDMKMPIDENEFSTYLSPSKYLGCMIGKNDNDNRMVNKTNIDEHSNDNVKVEINDFGSEILTISNQEEDGFERLIILGPVIENSEDICKNTDKMLSEDTVSEKNEVISETVAMGGLLDNDVVIEDIDKKFSEVTVHEGKEDLDQTAWANADMREGKVEVKDNTIRIVEDQKESSQKFGQNKNVLNANRHLEHSFPGLKGNVDIANESQNEENNCNQSQSITVGDLKEGQNKDDEANKINNADTESKGFKVTYVCHVCDKSFNQQRYLRKHVRNMHPEQDMVIPCGNYSKEVFSKLNQPHGQYSAQQNGTSFLGNRNTVSENRNEVLVIRNGVGNSNRSLPECNKVVNANDIHRHLQPNCTQLLRCSLCGEQFSHINKLIGHVLGTHETIGKLNGAVVVCMICGKDYNADASALKHITEHIVSKLNNGTPNPKAEPRFIPRNVGQNMSCNICGKRFTQRGHLSRHIKSKACSENYMCVYCDKGFHTPGQLRVHKKSQHNVKAYECPFCQKAFKYSSGLIKHKKLHVSGTSELAYTRPFMCSICGKQYTMANSLKTHMIVHTDTRPFKCDQCDRTFLQSSHLLRHISGVHMGIRKFKCDVLLCNKSFQDQRNLRIHKRSHTKEKPFECSECGRRFSQKQNLNAHTKTHREMRGFECMICNRQLSSKLSLMRHMDRHEDSLTGAS